MIVMTVDQRKSRTSPDRVDALLQWLAGKYQILRPFERTAGDEIQGVLDDGMVAVEIALELSATRGWSVGIGVGIVELPLPAQTRAGRGAAFEYARDAVDRAKNSSGSLAVSGPGADPGRIEAELQLIALLDVRRTESSAEAGKLVAEGLSQQEVAAKLGVSQQAVSQRLASGLWHETRKLTGFAARALDDYARGMESGK